MYSLSLYHLFRFLLVRLEDAGLKLPQEDWTWHRIFQRFTAIEEGNTLREKYSLMLVWESHGTNRPYAYLVQELIVQGRCNGWMYVPASGPDRHSHSCNDCIREQYRLIMEENKPQLDKLLEIAQEEIQKDPVMYKHRAAA